VQEKTIVVKGGLFKWVSITLNGLISTTDACWRYIRFTQLFCHPLKITLKLISIILKLISIIFILEIYWSVLSYWRRVLRGFGSNWSLSFSYWRYIGPSSVLEESIVRFWIVYIIFLQEGVGLFIWII